MENKNDQYKLMEKIDFIKKYKLDKNIICKITKLIDYYEPNNNIKITSRIKDFDSAYLKYKEKKYNNINQIKDLIGIMIVCQNKKQIYRVIEYIEKELNVIKLKDYIKRPKIGYKSVHVNVENEFGMIYEIQLKTEGMKIAQKVVHNNIYKNRNIPKILKKIFVPIVFNIVLFCEDIILLNKIEKIKKIDESAYNI